MLLGAMLPGTGITRAETAQSPRVREMVKKGVAYLNKNSGHSENGGVALVGLAMLKSDQKLDHPAILAGVKACRAQAAVVGRSGIGEHTYSTCICAIFLCELDAQQFRPEIEVLLRGIAARELPNGCWGYKIYKYDDTSQSQFGMLAFWAAHKLVLASSRCQERRLGVLPYRSRATCKSRWVHPGYDRGRIR
jgi:hypothetical protein